MSEVYEVKYQIVDKWSPWENKRVYTQVALDDQEVDQYYAWSMHINKKIDEVRYNRQGSTQGHYITRQMAERIISEQLDQISAMDPKRLNMLCLVLLDTFATAATDYWTTKVFYDYKEDENDNMVDAWSRVTVWSEDENDGRKFYLTPFTIEKGIRTIVDTPGFQLNKDLWKGIAWADKHPEDADIDAEMGDCIVQAALFGEVVYG